MVPDPATSCLGLEYFCFEGDGLWSKSDRDLVALGRMELEKLGLARAEDVVDGCVVRMPKAYPVYDDKYRRGIEAVRAFLEGVPNLQVVGRNGMHKYNNQDHSMLTAMLAARNIIAARAGDNARFDLWQVNADDEYHESGSDKGMDQYRLIHRTQPRVPAAIGK